MGMSSYCFDLQDQFEDKCADIAKGCETFREYAEKAVLHDDMVAWMDEQEVADILAYVWHEVWSKYQ